MPDEENYFRDTRRKLRQYVQQRVLLVRLQAAEKASRIAAALITAVLVIVAGLFLLIFISIAAGLWLANITGSLAAGFGIVALFYLLAFLVIILFMKKILQNFFINKFIHLIHKKD
jgi:pilus assembly protein TadC